MRIDVFDTTRREWRDFEVVPPDPKFVPQCANGLHQFYPGTHKCSCGAIER